MIAPNSFYRTTPEYQMAFDEGYEYAKAQAQAIISAALLKIAKMEARTMETGTVSTGELND